MGKHGEPGRVHIVEQVSDLHRLRQRVRGGPIYESLIGLVLDPRDGLHGLYNRVGEAFLPQIRQCYVRVFDHVVQNRDDGSILITRPDEGKGYPNGVGDVGISGFVGLVSMRQRCDFDCAFKGAQIRWFPMFQLV